MVAAFALTIVIGAIALQSPMASRHEPLNWIDALFTATSAVCVTGLTTIDVGSQLSGPGQIILLILVQLGGLGITTFAMFLLVTAGRSTLVQQIEAKDQLLAGKGKYSHMLWWVVGSTLLIEGIGFLILARVMPGPDRWWSALFHSVSAFCNAGFSLYPDSLTRFATDGTVNATISSLIILGGLGFIVHWQVGAWMKARWNRQNVPLAMHARVVLVGSIVLWMVGTFVFLGFEGNHTLSAGTAAERLMVAAFHSVTMRTAGFNSLDFGALREVTLYAAMFFMFVGAGSGSCAGGIKVTTAAVLLATVRARIRGEEHVSLFYRTIPTAVVKKAFQLMIVAVLFLSVILLGLLIFESRPRSADVRNDQLTVLSFEAVSAFATVGLSTGITPTLSTPGKLLIIVCMFVGRLGLLVVAMVVLPERTGPRYEYPREDLAIG